MSFFVISQTKKIKENAFELIMQNVNSITLNVDDEANTLDTVAQNVAYSNLVKERFANYVDNVDTNNSTKDQNVEYNNLQNTKRLIDMLTAIIGPNRPVSQIYLYSLDKGTFGVGLDTSTSNLSSKDFSWYEPFISSKHYKLYTCDTDKRLEKFYTYKNGATFLSLYTMYYDVYNLPQGVIETKKSISSLTDKIDSIIKTYDEEIYIYDQAGKTIYPLDDQASNYYNFISSNKPLGDLNNNVVRNKMDDNTYLFYKTSDYTGFTVAIAVKNSNLLKPIFQYVLGNILFLVIIILATLLLSFIVSRIITTPIMKIYKQVYSFKLDMDNTNMFPDIDTHIIELNTLYSALIAMQNKTQLSMEREMTLQKQEMQSRMLALQSQMNPHFLYNSLATIQSMADEHMNDEIHAMCQNISNILRYISSDKELLVPLSLELKHTIDYIQCMKMRYDDDLTYEVNIPDELLNIKIPKLCLQLIVENSIKFSTKSVRPPWHISIKGKITRSFWELSISDNGIGFSQSDLEDLNNKIDEINKTGLLTSLEINGMGLMNVYIRFKLLYKGSHIFRITNLATGGAMLIIGGKIDE
jgi:sensor histidine kinase YesM